MNLYGPRDNFDLETSHVIPALIRKMAEAAARGERASSSGVTGRRRASSSTSTTAWKGSSSPPTATTGRSRSTSGTGEEISIRDLAGLVAELTGFEGELAWDTSRPGGQPRRRLDVTRAEELFGFRAQTSLRTGLERTVSWYAARRAELQQPAAR